MSNLLESLMGGQPQRRDEYRDFVNRYDEGPPWAGISDDEAIDRYHEIAPQLPPESYEEAAHEAFARMSPHERRQFAQYLRQQARQQNMNFPDFDQDGIDDRFENDPRFMAQMAGRMHRQQPGMFAQLATGGRGRQGQGQRRQAQQKKKKQSSPLDNPLAKAALAGIAAVAVKKML